MVDSGRIDAMFVRNDFPELCSDLVAALAGLQVDNFSHFFTKLIIIWERRKIGQTSGGF